MPWATGGKKMAAKERGIIGAMLVGAFSPTVQKCVWTSPLKEYRSWKGIDYNPF